MPAQTYTDVNIRNFVYKEPTKNAKGGLNLYIDTSKTDRSAPKFQLAAKMRAPFGIRDPPGDGGPANNNPRKNMEVSVDDPNLLTFLEALDAQNIDVASENSVAWFKKQLTAEQLAATLYRHSTSPDAAGRFAPLLRLKINAAGTRNPTRIFVANPVAPGQTQTYTPGTIEDCTPQSHVTPIVQLGGMWFISKAFGMSINCTDLLVYPAKPKDEAFPFSLDVPAVCVDAPMGEGGGSGHGGHGDDDDGDGHVGGRGDDANYDTL